MGGAIEREAGVHGEAWAGVHGGYFSDPAVAAPLAGKAAELARATGADVVVDVGGGTGFLLAQVRAALGAAAGIRWVNVEGSAIQRAAAERAGWTCVAKELGSFRRADAGPEHARFLFLMRSVLHYLGEGGLRPALEHLRRQARCGERFVHQTASFGRKEDADCLNELYGDMRTGKWYPTVEELRAALEAEGWRVAEVRPAASLRLGCAELGTRYGIGAEELVRIGARLARRADVSADVFRQAPEGWCAFLHYWTFECEAAEGDGG